MDRRHYALAVFCVAFLLGSCMAPLVGPPTADAGDGVDDDIPGDLPGGSYEHP